MTIFSENVDGADVGDEIQTMTPGQFHEYEVYGIGLRTSFPLHLPGRSSAGVFQIQVLAGLPGFFSDLILDVPLQQSPYGNFFYAHLQDGTTYVRWNTLGEFLVSADGQRITSRRFDGVTLESFQVYLLGQAISFALVKSGQEPLHATCVVIDGEAIALLGDSGYGKSSLAACFLQAGHRLLTDDLLIAEEIPGGFQAHPGPPRIKLFPEMAQRFLGESLTGVPMIPEARKLIMPLDPGRVCTQATPLAAIYAIAAPDEAAQQEGVHIESVPSRDAFVLLMANVFNYVILDSKRLQRQFKLTARLAAVAQVKRLSYPRIASVLPMVRDAIVSDLRQM